MTHGKADANKALVLEAFDALFNRRDYAAAERFWSPRYIQHSAHIAPGRDGLFNLIRAAPVRLRYEHGLILADDDHVMVHGRFVGSGRSAAWIAVDILRIEDGVLAESAGRGDPCLLGQRPADVRGRFPCLILFLLMREETRHA
jgi:predicted SnoaL-like aldol condensation-catalyzing enzyme